MLFSPQLKWALVCLALCCTGARAQAPSPESVVSAFHEALRNGNAEVVKQLLAPDAIVVEGGQVESREQYLSHHLAADIEFAKAVQSKPLSSQTTLNGATAWVSSTSTSEGQLRGRAVKLRGAELVVLTQSASSWVIRAVHWSSQ